MARLTTVPIRKLIVKEDWVLVRKDQVKELIRHPNLMNNINLTKDLSLLARSFEALLENSSPITKGWGRVDAGILYMGVAILQQGIENPAKEAKILHELQEASHVLSLTASELKENKKATLEKIRSDMTTVLSFFEQELEAESKAACEHKWLTRFQELQTKMKRQARQACASYYDALAAVGSTRSGAKAMQAIRDSFVLPSEQTRTNIL